jgi:hypothetical protein
VVHGVTVAVRLGSFTRLKVPHMNSSSVRFFTRLVASVALFAMVTFSLRAVALVMLSGAWLVPGILGSGGAAMASNLALVSQPEPPSASSFGLRIGGEHALHTSNTTPRPQVGSSVAARCARYGERCDYSPCCAGLACVIDHAKYINVCVTPQETSPRGVR